MKRIFIVLYLVIFHLFLVIILVNPEFLGKLYYKLGIIDIPLSRHDYYREATWYYYSERSKTLDPQSDKLIFFGNSIINRMCVEEQFDAINFGISNETIKMAKENIKLMDNLSNKRIILAYGINDIPGNVNHVYNNYKSLIDNIPDNATIYISSLLPINDKSYKKHFGNLKSNSQINELNNYLKDFAQSMEKIHYLNTAKYLCNSSGQLANDCHIGDGIHLNNNGYELLVKGFRKELRNLDFPDKN